MLIRALLFLYPAIVLAQSPAAYTIQTVAGNNSVGDGGSASAAILSQPEGVAVDSAGNLYIADADDSRIRRVSPGGIIQTVAGTGYPGFNGDAGLGVQTQLDHPYGLALDAAGNLYIADLGNGRIRKLSPDGQMDTIAGAGLTSPGSGAESLLARDTKLNAPRNVAVDVAGTLYFSDFGAHQVYRVDPSGILTIVAGTGKAGTSADNVLARNAQLSAPAGLAVDSNGNLYVADSGNAKVRRIARGIITTVFTIGAPTGLAISSSGTLYVAAESYFGTIARRVGSGVFARDVAVDPSGNLFLTSPGVVRLLAVNGTITIKAGSGASRYYGGDGGPPSMARLHSPAALVQDDLGNTFIADTENNRIRKITLGGVMTTLVGTGEAGAKNGNGSPLLAQLKGPRGLAVDSIRNLYVADSGNNRILKLTPGGALAVLADKLKDPGALAMDANDSLYVADTGNNRILKITPAGVVDTWLEVVKPAGLAFDSFGALFISESSRVSKLPKGGLLTTVLDGLRGPAGLTVTPSGDLVLAESGAQRVQMIKPNGTISTIAGTGAAGFSGDFGLAAAAQLNTPSAVWADAFGTLWVSDTGNNRIRTLTSSTTGPSVNPSVQIALVHAATLLPGPVSPEEIITLYGSGFDAEQTQVLFDGNTATIFYANATQINALVPASLKPGGYSDLSIVVRGLQVSEQLVSVAAAVPGLFVQSDGNVAALNEDGTVNTADTPGARGSVVTLYGTGWSAASGPPTVTIGSYRAEILYAGPAPGYLGLRQINVRIPAGFLAPGIQPIVITVAGMASPDSVTLVVN